MATAQQARDFATFLKSPSLGWMGQSAVPFRDSITLFVVLSALMVGASLLLLPFVWMMGASPSGSLEATMSVEPLRLIMAVVVLGPLVEELIFRSWLSGQWRDLIAASVFGVVLYGSRAWADETGWGEESAAGYLIIAAALAAFVLARQLRTSPDGPRVFSDHFRWVFWISVVIFGSLHVTNYAGAGGLALIVFTLPQVIAGAAFGYARIRIGLIAAIALHMAYNSVPVIATLAARAI